jgi:hypothetical protein
MLSPAIHSLVAEARVEELNRAARIASHRHAAHPPGSEIDHLNRRSLTSVLKRAINRISAATA